MALNNLLISEYIEGSSFNKAVNCSEDVGGRLKAVSSNMLNSFATLDSPVTEMADSSNLHGADNVEEF
ncbi:MAG: hypothetical protein AAF716_16625 [Cyanobacteria bacterium P01_D01_bin.1]